jgi:tetratricopeptide (TPR) repeat protein
MQGRYEQATEHFQQALRLACATGQQANELDVLFGLGLMQGRAEHATDNYQYVLRLARAAGLRVAEQAALNGLGSIHRIQGRYQQATEHYQQLLDVAHETGAATGSRSLATRLDILASLGVEHTEDEETNVAAIRARLANLDYDKTTAPKE